MYPLQTGNTFMVQQSVSGTGVYDGTEYGRAKGVLTSGDPDAIVRFSSKLYGVVSNSYSIVAFDAGAGVTVTTTTVSQLGSVITVNLRRNTTTLLATANEVAEAINNAKLGVVAIANGTGNSVVTPATVLFSGGVDPAIKGVNQEQFLWYYPANQNGGFFYFEQQETIMIQQFEAQFTVGVGTFTMNVLRANLNSNLEVIATETIADYTRDDISSTLTNTSFSDTKIFLHPFQAMLVTTSGGGLPGVVRFDVRKASRFPYY